jgi:hypothetical protein
MDISTVFLGQLSTLLERGEVSYRNYIHDGKIFLYAKILKDNNEKIRDLILENAHLLPSEQQSHAIKLVSHIDIWVLLWEDTNEKLSPILTDVFSFKNDATFPTESESSLMSYYSLIKNN